MPVKVLAIASRRSSFVAMAASMAWSNAESLHHISVLRRSFQSRQEPIAVVRRLLLRRHRLVRVEVPVGPVRLVRVVAEIDQDVLRAEAADEVVVHAEVRLA